MGILGAGGIAETHLNAYRRAGADVVALAELDDDLRDARAQAWGVPHSYRDYRDLLAESDIFAVSVCLPNALHAQATIEAAEAGKHVLCEKPVATSTEDVHTMIAAAERCGVTLSVNHQLRSSGPAQRAKRLIDEGALGDIAFVRLRQAHDWGGLPPRASFTTRASAGGGTLLDNGCHLFDLARFFAGEVAKVTTQVATRQHRTELEDTAQVSLRFASGALGSLEAAWTATGWEEGFWIYGTEGSLEVSNRLGPPVLRHRHRSSPWTTWDDTDLDEYRLAAASISDHSRHIDAFLRAAHLGTPNPCSAAEGLEALRLVLAAYRSADTDAPVTVGDVMGTLTDDASDG